MNPSSARYYPFLWKNPHNLPMKYKLTVLAALLAAIGLAAIPGNGLPYLAKVPSLPNWLSNSANAQDSTPSTSSDVNERIEEQGSTKSGQLDRQLDRQQGPTQNGQYLMHKAAEKLGKEPVLQAAIRHRIHMFGHKLVGTGYYRQFQQDGISRHRLEFKTQVAGEVTSLTQVCDGRHLWVRESSGDTAKLSRIDVRRVLRAISDSEIRSEVSQIRAPLSLIALGGIPRLMGALQRSFVFVRVEEDNLGGVPVWVLHGHWTEAYREQIKSTFPTLDGKVPDHLPDSAKVVLARGGGFDLFPFKIHFQKRGAYSTDHLEDRPIVSLQLYQVTRNVHMEASQFEYQRGDQVVLERTDALIGQLLPASEEPAEDE